MKATHAAARVNAVASLLRMSLSSYDFESILIRAVDAIRPVRAQY
jgi:hypothetical protein